jgi:hypothetical protein
MMAAITQQRHRRPTCEMQRTRYPGRCWDDALYIVGRHDDNLRVVEAYYSCRQHLSKAVDRIHETERARNRVFVIPTG